MHKRTLLSIAAAGIGGLFLIAAFTVGGYFTGRVVGGATSPSAEINVETIATQGASAINATTPMMVDRETELMNAIGIGSTLTYNYRLVNVVAAEMDKQVFESFMMDDIKPQSTRQACTTPEVRADVLDNGLTMRYAYYDKHREYIGSFSIRPADC